MPAAVLPPQSFTATVGYHLEPERGGAADWCPGTVQDKRRPHDHQEVYIESIRGREDEFTLDKQGFQVIPFSTKASYDDFDDNQVIAGQYYKDVAEHVKKATGASRVMPVVHICRKKPWEEVLAAEKDMDDKAAVTAPSYNRSVHIDQSYVGAELVLNNKLVDHPDAERLKSGRWAIVNLWRSLNDVTRDNLAVCDARSTDENDLVALFAELPKSLTDAKSGYNFAAGAKSGAWEVKANPAHKWYCEANMTPDEALLIKQFDSKTDGGIARRTPHTAFSASSDYGPTRQSIEVRCLVFWEDQ